MQARRDNASHTHPRRHGRPRIRAALLVIAHGDAGFSLVEMFLICAMIGTLSAVALLMTAAAIKPTKAESAVASLKSFLQVAREHAIEHRRLVRISFPEANQIASQEVQLDGTLRDLTTLTFENKMEFTTFDSVPDTPDRFGHDDAVYFTGQQPVSFTSDGMFVDVNGDPTSGTLSIGVPHDVETVGAITVLGTTALIRQWRWNGRQWVE